MKSAIKIIFLLAIPFLAGAQTPQKYPDSLMAALRNAANDTVRLDISRKLGFYHQDSQADSALVYHMSQLELAKKLNLKLWEADAYQQIGYCYLNLDNLPVAYENYMQAMKMAEDPSTADNGWGYENFSYSNSPEEARQSIVGMMHFELSGFYKRTRFYDESLEQLFKAVRIGERLKNQKILSLSNRDIGTYYLRNNYPDSAYVYFQKALMHYQNSPYQKNLGVVYLSMAYYHGLMQEYDLAKANLRKAMDENAKSSSLTALGLAYRFMGRVHERTGQLDSALEYTFTGLKIADSLNDYDGMINGNIRLGNLYKLKNDYALAYDYLEKGKNISDSVNDSYITRLMQFQNLDFDQKIRLEQLEKENQQVKSRNRMYASLTGLGVFLLVAIFLYRNNRQKQKANTVLEKTLSDLKSTQSQLIQSEKMASLGELTAGIAHEIQNPLNFVNNFSEVSSELVDEMNQELDKGDIPEAKTIAADLKQNLEKINHHGKRADSIVKGMLQHSRGSEGKKTPIDINNLADEYLRLAYHGLRARDKSFNAAMETDLDPQVGTLEIVPQDIGRVILNLVTNAFHAVSERKATAPEGFEPTVWVTTRKTDTGVQISVRDNGGGIPAAIREKIFQPFFTTKPTGQGTGLGLSMSYEIVTKGHGGDLKVASQEGEGTTFTVSLPGQKEPSTHKNQKS